MAGLYAAAFSLSTVDVAGGRYSKVQRPTVNAFHQHPGKLE
jgi:hypothetical protein